MTELVGSVVAFAGPKIPKGYLPCDGAVYDRTDKRYRELFNAIGTSWGGDGAKMFRVPDLQGLFLRGVSGKSGRDPDSDARSSMYSGDINPGNKGNSVGSFQLDDVVNHSHETPRPAGRDGNRSGQQDAWYGGSPTSSTGTFGGQETRPKNAYVQWLIQYE